MYIFKNTSIFTFSSVAPEGVVIVAGTASRLVPTIKTSDLLPVSFSLIGVSLRNYRKSIPEVYRY
jgi:arginine deiminase